MGFVVENHLNDSLKNTAVAPIKRKNQAVVYGKAEYMWAVRAVSLQSTNSGILCTAHLL